jgi:hypothetical protein
LAVRKRGMVTIDSAPRLLLDLSLRAGLGALKRPL